MWVPPCGVHGLTHHSDVSPRIPSSDSTFGAVDSQSGVGAAGSAAGVSFFEMSQPLSTGDPDDFSLAHGGSVGYCLISALNGTGGDNSTLPRGCQGTASGQADYGVMQIR